MRPVDVDGVRTVAVGTVLWAITFVVLVLFRDDLDAEGVGWWCGLVSPVSGSACSVSNTPASVAMPSPEPVIREEADREDEPVLAEPEAESVEPEPMRMEPEPVRAGRESVPSGSGGAACQAGACAREA